MASESYLPLSLSSASRNSIICTGLVVDGVLDVDLLRHACSRLLEQWPLLRGVLLKNLPIHITSGSLIPDFLCRTIPSTLQQTFPYLTCPAPRPVPPTPTYHTTSTGLLDTAFHWDPPSDRPASESTPVFALRATLLGDATLLGFRIAHYAADASSAFAVARAFAAVVRGERLPPLRPPPDTRAPVSALVHGGRDEDAAAWRALALEDLRGWAGASAEPGVERMVHLPAGFVDGLRAACQAALDAAGREPLVLTRNDVLTAWMLTTSYAAYPPTPGPVTLGYAASFRSFMPARAGEEYLHNSAYMAYVRWPSVRALQTQSLAEVAAAVRRSCTAVKTPGYVRAELEYRESVLGCALEGFPVPAGTQVERLALCSSWTACAFNELDFSAGLVDAARGTGRVVFTLPMDVGTDFKPMWIPVKDGKGGYWIRAVNTTRGWEGHGV